MNILKILAAIKNGEDPQQLVMSILEGEMGNTPMGQNLLRLAKEQRGDEIEKIARNLCAQRGLDFDKEFMSFKQRIGLK